MATIPTAPTWLVGEKITDVDLQAMSDYMTFWGERKPICSLVQTSAQTGWTTATYTAITFTAGSEVLDTDSQHSTSSNTSRITIGNTLGWYRLTGLYASPGNTATSLIRCGFTLNGSLIAGSPQSIDVPSSSNAKAVVAHSVIVEATSASDYVECVGWQTAGSGTIGTLVSGGTFASAFTAEYIKKP